MSVDYMRESGVFCQVSPLVLAHGKGRKADRIEKSLQQKNLFEAVEAQITTAENVVGEILGKLSMPQRKRDLRWGVSLDKRLKQLDKSLSGIPRNLLSRVAKAAGQFEMVWGYSTSDSAEEYKESITGAGEAILLEIFTMLKIEEEPSIYCFVNEGNGYPYIEESFEFGRLYFCVAFWKREERVVIRKFTPVENHDWIYVCA